MTVKIRTARTSDLPAIAGIHVSSWRSTYRGIISDAIIDAVTVEKRLSHWQTWSQEPNVILSVAEGDGEIIGFCRLCPARDVDQPPPNFAEVTNLYVSPGATGNGIGGALFTEALEKARGMAYDGLLLWVLEENDGALRFYSSHGLHFDGARHTEPAWLGEGVFEVRYRITFPKSAA